MSLRTKLINVLADHQGRERGIDAAALATKMGVSKRQLRKLISQARDGEGFAICGHPSHGYYMATTPEELQASCKFLETRALHSLRLLSRMRKVSLPDLLGQLKLNQA